MAKLNRVCKVCGSKYRYCPSCETDLRPTWYAMFHDENCKNIFMILTDEFLKKITTLEAKKELKKCDLSNSDNFTESIKKHLDNVMNYKVKNKTTLPKQKEEVVVDIEENDVNDVEIVNE